MGDVIAYSTAAATERSGAAASSSTTAAAPALMRVIIDVRERERIAVCAPAVTAWAQYGRADKTPARPKAPWKCADYPVSRDCEKPHPGSTFNDKVPTWFPAVKPGSGTTYLNRWYTREQYRAWS